VPFGSIGLTLFAIDLYFATPHTPPGVALGALEFARQAGSWRVLLDLGLIGVFGGLFIVPLYALVQQRTRREIMSRVIGANSILNAVFMVAAALLGAMALQAGFSIPQLLLVTGVLNLLVAVYIYSLVPEFLLRFLSWLLVHVVYRLRKQNLEHIPDTGPALLISNHVGFADAIVISAAVRRPIRFIMESSIFEIPVLSTIFRGMKAIPVASAREQPEVYERAFTTVARELRDGHLVCIFPEGRLTTDGEIAAFRPGMLRILKETPVPVVPMSLSGLWDSMFSRKFKSPWHRWPRRFWARITLRVGVPLPPETENVDVYRDAVTALRGAER
jgi:1-acyl-sn-glycerol-3-phosphate acyltransferase